MGPPSPVSSSSHNAETRSTSPDAAAASNAAAAASNAAAAAAAHSVAKSMGVLQNNNILSDAMAAGVAVGHPHGVAGLAASGLVPPASAFSFAHGVHHPSLGMYTNVKSL